MNNALIYQQHFDPASSKGEALWARKTPLPSTKHGTLLMGVDYRATVGNDVEFFCRFSLFPLILPASLLSSYASTSWYVTVPHHIVIAIASWIPSSLATFVFCRIVIFTTLTQPSSSSPPALLLRRDYRHCWASPHRRRLLAVPRCNNGGGDIFISGGGDAAIFLCPQPRIIGEDDCIITRTRLAESSTQGDNRHCSNAGGLTTRPVSRKATKDFFLPK